MDKIKISTICTAIETADGIKVGGQFTKQADVYAVQTGDPDNEMVYIEWVDEDKSPCYTKITEAGLNEATVHNNVITVTDHEGEEITLKLYALTPYNL